MDGSDLSANLIAGAALLVSVFTLWHTDRRQRQADLRQFVRQSLDTATNLDRGLLHYSGMVQLATHPDEVRRHYQEQVEPFSMEMWRLQTEAARFQRESFFPAFDELVKLADAIHKTVLPAIHKSVPQAELDEHRERIAELARRYHETYSEYRRLVLAAQKRL